MKIRARLVTLATALCLVASGRAQTADSLVAEARIAIVARDYTTASDKLDAALALDANHGDANALAALAVFFDLADENSTQDAFLPFGLQSATIDGEIRITDPNQSFPTSAKFGQWSYYSNAASDSSDALLSGSPPPEYSSNLTTSITGPGTLEFSWANYAPEWASYSLSLIEDGSTVATLPTDTDWSSYQHSVPEGTHSYTWRFHNSSYWTNLDAYAGLDRVIFNPDGENSTPDDGSQTGLTLANGVDNNSLSWSSQGSVRFDPTHSLNNTRDFATSTFTAELKAAAVHLELAASNPSYTITLDDSETGSSTATADSGDLKLLASGFHIFRSILLCLSVYDMDASLGVIHEIDNSIYLDPQSLLAAYPSAFTLQSVAKLPEAKEAFLAAHNNYLAASTFIRSRESEEERLFEILEEDLEMEEEFRDSFSKIVASIDEPQQVDGTTLDLSPLFVDGFDLNAALPHFVFGKIVEDSFPDPTFQGILPDNTNQKLNTRLRQTSKVREIPLSDKVLPVTQTGDNSLSYDAATISMTDINSDGSKILLRTYKDGVYKAQIYSPSDDQLTPLTDSLGNNEIELPPNYPFTYLSEDGNYAFFSSSSSTLVEGLPNPPSITEIASEGTYLSLPWGGYPGSSKEFFVDGAAPNAGTYPAFFSLQLEFYWPLTQGTLLLFELENPLGQTTRMYAWASEGESTLYLNNVLSVFSDSSAWEGIWKLTPITSNNDELWEASIHHAELRLDSPPAQIFRKNLNSGEIEVVSQSSGGELIELPAYVSSKIASDDGRYVTFATQSNRIHADIDNSSSRHVVYRKDMQTGEVLPISARLNGAPSYYAYEPSISSDGEKIAFRTSESYLESDDNKRDDIYLYDIESDSYSLLSSALNGTLSGKEEGASHYNPLISADSSKVLFRSSGRSIITGTPQDSSLSEFSILLKDTTDQELEIVDADTNGDLIDSPDTLFPGDLSSDGRFVVYASRKQNQIDGFQQDPEIYNIYLYDSENETTINLTANEDEPSPHVAISGDASTIAFSRGTELTVFDRESLSSKKVALEYQPAGYVSLQQSSFQLTESAAYASVDVIWNFKAEEPDSIEVDLVTYRGNVSAYAPQVASNRTVTLTKSAPSVSIDIPIIQGFIHGYIGFAGVYIDEVRGSNIGPFDDCLIGLSTSENQNALHAYLSQFLPEGVEPYAYSPLADLDDDGIVNYLEMLLGGNPLARDASEIFRIEEDLLTGDMNLHIQVNTNIKTGVYLEISNDLGQPWHSIPIDEITSVEGVVTTEAENGILSLEIDASSLPLTNAQFFRLRMDI